MTDTVARFSNRVANYIKYRPHYPREIIGYLESKCGLTHETVIADIGCGTGISTALFLENCNAVYGVEPNDAMREAAVEFLKDFPAFTPVNGSSEATTLPDNSVDMVVAAQAFHWFDPEKTKLEFQRILRSGGHVVLMWNERQLDTTPFLIEYEELLVKYSTDYTVVRHDKFDATVLDEYFDQGVQAATFPNVQIFDFEGLKGRMLSASYMPSETDEEFGALVAELQTIFAKHAENGRIKLLYDTNVYHSRI
jgi:SAM-dependent methyltransferase